MYLKTTFCLFLAIGMHDSQMACLRHNAAWYITRLLISTTPQGVAFSFLFFSFSAPQSFYCCFQGEAGDAVLSEV